MIILSREKQSILFDAGSGLRLLDIHLAAEVVGDGSRRGRQLQLRCFKHSDDVSIVEIEDILVFLSTKTDFDSSVTRNPCKKDHSRGDVLTERAVWVSTGLAAPITMPHPPVSEYLLIGSAD